ncbi:hypothetical protein RYZ26_19405 [Terasakiella sp. A23]|uniref:hypothetical protein n=1 Tax=Terasakiella sp. FCG-A23 TaxID=3080561 RepID=UPI002954A6CE|nr:hypothetical protein [Terasakiella sp. A23]MDV7341777.1 hypothetical protein [Terasakiella sp. A23]
MTLRVDRIEKIDGTKGVDTDVVYSGLVKAWMNYSQWDSVVDDSFNFSSVIDHGQSDFSHNLTSHMANTGYCVHCTWAYQDADTSSSAFYYYHAPGQRLTCAISYSRVNQFGSTDSGISSDSLLFCVSHQGDLA